MLPAAGEQGAGGEAGTPPCQIISYLRTLPTRSSPLTSVTPPRRLATTAADVWLPSTAGTTARPGQAPAPFPNTPPGLILILIREPRRVQLLPPHRSPPHRAKPAKK